MPTIPEILDVCRQKRRAKVARRANAEAIAGAHGHEAVPREIEEQIQAVFISDDDLLPQLDSEGAACPAVRVIDAKDIGRYDHLVEHARRKEQNSSGKQPRVFVAGRCCMQVFKKSSASVDRTRGEDGKEQDETSPVGGRYLLYDAIVDFDGNLQRLECEIRYARKSQDARVECAGDLACDKWIKRQGECGAESPFRLR